MIYCVAYICKSLSQLLYFSGQQVLLKPFFYCNMNTVFLKFMYFFFRSTVQHHVKEILEHSDSISLHVSKLLLVLSSIALILIITRLFIILGICEIRLIRDINNYVSGLKNNKIHEDIKKFKMHSLITAAT